MTNHRKAIIFEQSSHLLSNISMRIRTEFGMNFGSHKLDTLYEKLEPIVRERFGDSTPDIWTEFSNLTWDYQLSQQIITAITVPETYFFRDKAMFEFIEHRIIPEFSNRLRSGEQITIWSASCCTGEEAYSLAMTLKENIPAQLLANCSILATDLCERYLETARRGRYGEFALRSTPAAIREKYFARSEQGGFELAESIKSMVRFSCTNLLNPPMLIADPRPGSVDLLCCKNTLIYFGDAEIETTMNLLADRLKKNGWLFLAPAEVWKASPTQFRTEWFPGVAALHLHSGEEPDQRSSLPPIKIRTKQTAQTVVPDKLDQEVRNPDDEIFARAEGLITAGSFEDAEFLLSGLAERIRQQARFLSLQSELAMGAGRIDLALEFAEKATTESPLSPTLHFKLALLHNELGDSEGAIHSLRRATFLKADYALAHYFLGTTYSRQEKHKRASVYFANARRILASQAPDEEVPHSGGITAGRLLEIIDSAGARTGQSHNETQAPLAADHGRKICH
jgi:chemotaxis protein methyltransferase CheR